MFKSNCKRIFCIGLACVLALLNLPFAASAAQSLNTLINPVLQEYTAAASGGSWSIKEDTRLLLSPDDADNERLQEVVALVNAELVEKKIPSDNALAMVFAPEQARGSDDIFIKLTDKVSDISGNTNSKEAYRIDIGTDGVLITAASENAALYGLRTVEQIMITNGSLPCGTIIDYPDMAERRLHVDCARKYFSKEWFIRQIREMSYMKMNTLQIHFSENLGFRIECETDPKIVSPDGYLTKDEVREIIAEAKKYGISIIPSFDSPGHTDWILKSHPEYRLKGNNNTYYDHGIDITNPEAVKYIYSLYDEYAELFKDSTDFHIGADEYMEYDRNPFQSTYAPVLTAYAVEKYGTGHSWKDAIAGYINELADHLEEKGFKVRIFNDGVYSTYGSPAQQININSDIGIDFWSSCSWITGHPTMQTFIDHGHTTIYNFNSSFGYYVLRSGPQTDGRPANSFDNMNPDRKIYDEWTPGSFPTYPISDDSPVIGGTGIGVWCDYPDMATEDTVESDIASPLRAMACRSWNTDSNDIQTWEDFKKVCDTLGHAAAWEKGDVLPEVGEFLTSGDLGRVTVHYVDENGDALRTDKVQYGDIGNTFSIEADEFYGYRLTSKTSSVSGTYTEEEQEITFTYEKYCDKKALRSALNRKLSQYSYIAETYEDYQQAYEAAKAVYDDDKSNQDAVDSALEQLQAAAGSAVELKYFKLYAESFYPAGQELFSSGYDEYKSAVDAGKELLGGSVDDKSASAALDAILQAKSRLMKKDGLTPTIETSADLNAYTQSDWDATITPDLYKLDNMIDGKEDTKTWFERNQTEGDWFTLTFPTELNMSAIRIIQPDDVGNDIIEGANVQIAGADGNYKTIGTLDSSDSTTKDFAFDKQGVKSVKIEYTKSKANWSQIVEIYFTYDQPQEDNTLLDLISEAEELEINGVQKGLLSDLSDAFIEARKAYSTGAQDTPEQENALREAIDAVKNRNVLDTEELDRLLEESIELLGGDYSDASLSALRSAVDSAESLTAYATQQKQIDDAVQALRSALQSVGTSMLGDVDSSGDIGTGDVTKVLQYIAGIVHEGDEGYDHSASDVTGDGETDTQDVTAILQYIATIITKFPADG